MAKQYLKALKTINFSDTGITLSSGRVFYLEGSTVYAYSGAEDKVISISEMGDWVLKLEPSASVEKTDSFAFKTFMSEQGKSQARPTAKPSSTTYQNVTTSVPDSIKFQPKSGHQAFVRPLANAAFNSPKAEVRAMPSPRVEVPHIKTATVETPTGKKVMDLTNGGQVKEEKSPVGNRFSLVDIPEGKEATPMDLDNLYKQSNQSPDGMYSLVESIEVAITEKAEVSEFESQWKEYMDIKKKADKVKFIEGLTFPGILQFFIDKTRDLVRQAEEGTYSLSKPMQKMHKNLISTMETQLKVGRLDV